ncbi:unnamed protein product, partial [Ectocarpus sp. 8 AP-2014]
LGHAGVLHGQPGGRQGEVREDVRQLQDNEYLPQLAELLFPLGDALPQRPCVLRPVGRAV